MAKLSGSIDVPLPPQEAWTYASDLSRFREWLTIHKVWRSKLPDELQKGTIVESYVEVKGMPNRIKWTIVHFKPPEAMTLNGDGVGGVKVKLMAKVTPKGDGSVVSFHVHLGGPALFGPIGLIVAAALKTDINESLQNFVRVFSGPQARPDPGRNGDRGASQQR
jgi:carbon monoxide dehydrogenase subunit G